MCDTKYIDSALGAVKGLNAADWAGIAVSAGTAGLAYYEGKQYSKSVSQAADMNYGAETSALNEQQRQVSAQATDQAQARSRQAMMERARVRVASAESGMRGGSNTRLVNEVGFNEGYDISSIEANKDARVNQINAERSGAAARRNSTKASARKPSLLGAGLTIAGAVASAASKRT